MKKVFLSAAIIVSFVLYSLKGRASEIVTSPVSPTSNPTPTAEVTAVPPTGSKYKNGEYTGTAADAFYGNIQVQAVIENGRLTDVQFLQYPNDHHESIEINERAMPVLTEEAIQAQSADVEIVSRATDSSKAFIESLSSALEQAQS